MHDYETTSDMIGATALLASPYDGCHTGTVVGDLGETLIVHLTSGAEIGVGLHEVSLIDY